MEREQRTMLEAAWKQSSMAPVEAAVQEDPVAAAMMSADRTVLRKRLAELSRGDAGNPLLCRQSAETNALLTISPDEIYDRSQSFVGATNLVSTLIVSGVLGSALSPIQVNELDANKRTLADVYNAIVVVLTVINVLQSSFTAYLVMELAATSTPAIYRALVHAGPFVAYQVLTYVSALLICGLACIAVWLRSSASGALFASIAGGVLALAMHTHFYSLGVCMFPYTMRGWTGSLAPCLAPRDAQARSKHSARFALRSASHLEKTDVAAVLDDDDEDTAPDDLRAFVRSALDDLDDDRTDRIAAAIFKEGFTLPDLQYAASSSPNVATLLYNALDFADLRRGDRLRLALAAADHGDHGDSNYTAA